MLSIAELYALHCSLEVTCRTYGISRIRALTYCFLTFIFFLLPLFLLLLAFNTMFA